MPFLATFLPGYGEVTVDSLAVTGAAAVTGNLAVTGNTSCAGQFLGKNGTAGSPAYSFTSRPTDGLINEVSRVGMVFGGADKAYWGSTNHNYQSTSVTGTLSATALAGALTALGLPVRSITATDTIVATSDFLILADPTAGAITVNLPTAASASGKVFVVRKTVASANAVTIDPNGAETIDGAATLAVADTSSVMFQSNGTTWHSIANE